MIMFRQLATGNRTTSRRELTLLNPDGLRAVPATEFVSCVLLFDSTVVIHAKGKRYPADRILEVLLADLNCGDTFQLEAEGRDAAQAVERIGRPADVLAGKSGFKAPKIPKPSAGSS